MMSRRTALPSLALLASSWNLCHSFRVSPLILPTRHIASSSSILALSTDDKSLPCVVSATHDDEFAKNFDVDFDPMSKPSRNRVVSRDIINNKIRKTHVLKNLFLSLAIFILPLVASQDALAVQSGGRMGGSAGGGSRSSGGGGSYSRGYSSGSSSFGRGYNGYYSRPSVIVSPGISPYYSPFYSPFSWGRSYSAGPGVLVTTGPSFGGIFFVAGFLLLAASALNTMSNGVGSSGSGLLGGSATALGPGVSVAEISVALDVSDRDSPNSILSVLERLSATARTDSRVGLQNLSSQVALELLRRKMSIVAASTTAKHFGDESKAQREFNNLSIRERGKFEREGVSKYGGVDYSSSKTTNPPTSTYSPKATMAVVTIILHIDGDATCNQLSSRVNSIRDVEDALSRIAADSKVDDCLRGVEILWTPEERDETLTMKEVLADYSDLRSV